jgi:competence protein ComEC
VTGPAVLVGGLVAGILLGDRAGAGSAIAPLMLGVLAAIAAWAAAGNPRRALALGAVAAALLGAALEQRALDGLDRSPLAAPTRAGARGVVDATLAEDPDGPSFAAEALARVERFAGRDAGGRTVLLAAGDDRVSAMRVLAAGTRIRVIGRLTALVGRDARFRWRHAVARLDIERVLAAAPPSAPWRVASERLRRALVAGAAGLPGDTRALFLGFLLGDTRDLSDATTADFRASGLGHLLAVSGANVAFVLAVVAPLLGRLPRWVRFAVGTVVLVGFGSMTRWEPSVTRAVAMAGLVLLARALGRPAAAGRVLALAVGGLLVVDPFLLHSIGFLLSCGACAGIVALAERIGRRLPGPRWSREALGATAGAQMGVAPVLLAVFGSVPLVALPANLVAAPFVGPLTVYGMVACGIGALTGPGVGFWVQLPTAAMLRAVMVVADLAARAPVALDARTVTLGALGALGVVLVGRRWSRRPGKVGRRGRCLGGEGLGPGAARP